MRSKTAIMLGCLLIMGTVFYYTGMEPKVDYMHAQEAYHNGDVWEEVSSRPVTITGTCSANEVIYYDTDTNLMYCGRDSEYILIDTGGMVTYVGASLTGASIK